MISANYRTSQAIGEIGRPAFHTTERRTTERRTNERRATSQPTLRALVATDDAALASTGDTALKVMHFTTRLARDERQMWESIRSDSPDLLILDTSLPGTDTLATCRSLRENPTTAGMSIMIIIDHNVGIAKNLALDMGADDCLAKPVQLNDLLPHIKAVCRRALQTVVVTRLRAGPIDMDIDRWTVAVDGTPVELTKTEFRLLQVLLEAKGRAVTREFILNKAWSYSAEHAPETRTVDVHIGRLRRKLGRAGKYIITVRNVGFRFDIVPEWMAPQIDS